jgi:hypothetical protein
VRAQAHGSRWSEGACSAGSRDRWVCSLANESEALDRSMAHPTVQSCCCRSALTDTPKRAIRSPRRGRASPRSGHPRLRRGLDPE